MLRKSILSTFILLGFLIINSISAWAQTKPDVTETPIYIALDSQPWTPCEGLVGCEFVSLFGDPSIEGSQSLFRLKAGTVFPKHWHTSSENYIGVTGQLEFNLETGENIILRHGDYLHYQGGMVHWGQCIAGEDCVYYVYNDQPYNIILVEE